MAEADAMPFDLPPGGPSPGIGEALRRARERAGLDRRDVASRTKINERHLAALEAGDFAALPGRIYAVGFARSYAGAVGLDGATIALEVRRALAERDMLASITPSHRLDLDDPAKVPSGRLAWAAGILGLAVIAAGAVLWSSYLRPAVDLPPVAGHALAAVAAEQVQPAARDSAAPAR